MEFEKFAGRVDAEDVYRATKTVIGCPVCHRLWIFWDKESDPAEYVLNGIEARRNELS
jgi:hypothetical protein